MFVVGSDVAENVGRGEEVVGELGMRGDVVEDRGEGRLGAPPEGDHEALHGRKDGSQPFRVIVASRRQGVAQGVEIVELVGDQVTPETVSGLGTNKR